LDLLSLPFDGDLTPKLAGRQPKSAVRAGWKRLRACELGKRHEQPPQRTGLAASPLQSLACLPRAQL